MATQPPEPRQIVRPPQISRGRRRSSGGRSDPRTTGADGAPGCSLAVSRRLSSTGDQAGSQDRLKVPSHELDQDIGQKDRGGEAPVFQVSRSGSKQTTLQNAAKLNGTSEPLQAKTIIFVAELPGYRDAPKTKGRKHSELPPCFHVHVPILRAYAPLLHSRLMALMMPAHDSSVIRDTESTESGQQPQRTLTPASCSGHPAESNAAPSMCFVLQEGIPPEVHMECSQRILAQAINWMYGTPLSISLDDMQHWAKENSKGCELLKVARDLGIDALETAVRRTIFEAISRCGSRFAWAMLSICHGYGLQRELEHCCTVIARNGGYGMTRARLRPLPLEVIDLLLCSTCWVVDDENDILAIVEMWMDCSPCAEKLCPSAARPSTANKSRGMGNRLKKRLLEEALAANAKQERRHSVDSNLSFENRSPDSICSPMSDDKSEQNEEDVEDTGSAKRDGDRRREPYKHSAIWNLRWGAVDRKRLEALSKAGVVPRSLLTDTDKWLHLIECMEPNKMIANLMSSQREWMENEVKVKEAMDLLSFHEEKLESMKINQESFSRQVSSNASSVGEETDSALQESALQEQERVTQEARDMLEEAEQAFAKSREMMRLHQGGKNSGVKLSLATSKWRRVASQQRSENVVSRFLWPTGRRRDAPISQSRMTVKPTEDGAEGRLEQGEVRDETNFATINCEWLKRRRCHHSCVHCPVAWSQHLSCFSAERDRISMILKPVVQLRFAPRHNFTLVSDRLMRRGRHEFMLRVTQRRAAPGQAGLWNNCLRFGIGVYNMDTLGSSGEFPHSEFDDQNNQDESPESPKTPPKSPRQAAPKVRDTSSLSYRYSPGGLPPEIIWAAEDTLNKCLKKSGWDKAAMVPDGGLIDLVVMLVYEENVNVLRVAAESMVCESLESSAFLRQHTFFDRWSGEQTLDEDLESAAVDRYEHSDNSSDNSCYCFCVEVHSKALACLHGIDKDTTISLEVLPQGALQRSWWVDIMDRSADGQPHCGTNGPPQWNVLPKVDIGGGTPSRRSRKCHTTKI